MAMDSIADSALTLPSAPLPTSADGSKPDLHAVSFKLLPPLHDGSSPLHSQAANSAPSTVVLDKAALGAISPAFPVNNDSVMRQRPVLRRPLLCLIQPRVSSGTTKNKFRLFPRLCLYCLHLLRRPCRPFFRRGSSRLGRAVAESPLLASLTPPWIMVLIDRILLHLPSHDQPPPWQNRARLGAPRLLRMRPGPPSTQFLLCRSNKPPIRPHLLRPNLVPSLQRHLGVSAPQSPSPRRHHRQRSTSSSLSRGTRTSIGSMNSAPNRFVTPHSDIFFSEAPQPSLTTSFFIWRLTNAPPLSDVLSLAAKSRLHRDDDDIFLLVRQLMPPAPACPDKPSEHAARLLHDELARFYVPLLMRLLPPRCRSYALYARTLF